MMNSMVEILAGYAGTQPDTLYSVDTKREYTYAQAWQQVRKAASAMVSLGLAAGDRVIVECTQDSRFLLVDLACELAGMIFVPIENKAAAERVNAIIEESEPVLFVREADYATDVRSITPDDLFGMDAPDMEFAFPAAETVVQILYTTGTTGKSKGIEITNANNVAIAENIRYGTEMKVGNVEMIPLPLSHSHGIRDCYANLHNGGTVVVLDGVMAVKLIFSLIEKYHITALDLSPSAALILMRLSKGKLGKYNDQLDYIEIGTAALPEETKQMLIDQFPGVRLYNFYGSTESGRSCALDFNAQQGRANCIGRPTKNAHFIITDDERHEIVSSKENTGLIATAGPMNMKGYYKQPELTAKTMQNGFIYTNDLGYIDEEGFVYVLGRKDDIINYKGIKIAPEEIEEIVRRYPKIKDCACVPKPDKTAGQVPKLFISLNDPDDFDRADFHVFLEGCIDNNKMPKEIVIIDEIPRTYNGKLQRAKLIEK